MADYISVLKKLIAAKAPSGFEKNAASVISSFAEELSLEVSSDALGNLIVHRKGVGKKVLLDAHMDTTGFLATSIDDKGFVRFDMLGGLETADLANIPVEFLNGVSGTVSYELKSDAKDRKISSFFIDIGAQDKKSAEALVLPGDAAVFSGKARILAKKRISAPYLDNKIGCAVLLSVLSELSECKYDVYAVFSVQEEVGCRGAKTAAFAIEPDFAITLDVTDSGDTPGFDTACEVKLGGGAAIKIMDKAAIANPAVVSALIETAEKEKIPYQRDVTVSGGTDSGSISLSRGGVPTGGISVPVRYMHSPTETAELSDIESCIKLLSAVLETHALI